MCAAFGVIYIIAETQNVFVKFIDILEGGLHGDTFGFAFKINGVVNTFLFFVQIADKTNNTFFFVKFNMLSGIFPSVFKYDGQLWIQVSGFMKSAFDFISLEAGFFKNLIIGQKLNAGSGFSCGALRLGEDRPEAELPEFLFRSGHDG